MSEAPTFGRSAEIPVDRMTPEQREGYRFLVDGPRGRVPGPYKVWVHNLVIDDRATMHRAHGDYDRSQSRVLWRIIVEGDRPRLQPSSEIPLGPPSV